MTAYVIVTGALFRAPETRNSKAGRPFVTATLKVRDGTDVVWWKIAAFSETVSAELSRLDEGDAVSIQGRFEATLYDQAGETRLRLAVVAEQITALRQPPKARPAKAPKSAPPSPDRHPLARHAGNGDDEFGDDVPL